MKVLVSISAMMIGLLAIGSIVEASQDAQTESTKDTGMKKTAKKSDACVKPVNKASKTCVEYDWINQTKKPTNDLTGVVGVATHGFLEPFGKIGGDCTSSWVDGKSFGGGFHQGTIPDGNKKSIGLGGGYSFNSTNVNVGSGIHAFDQTVNYNLIISENGEITITLDASKPFKCKPTSDSKVPNQIICSTSTA